LEETENICDFVVAIIKRNVRQ